MSSLEWMPDLAAALDELIPLEDSSRANWDDVAARVERHRRLPQLRRRRPHWSLRLAIVVALIFLLLGCAATVTYLLLRGNAGLAFPGVEGQLLIVGPDGSKRHTGRICSKWQPGDQAGCGVREPAWSPDGTRVAFIAGRRVLTKNGFGSDRRGNSVWVAAADGTSVRKLVRCGLCGEFGGSSLAWSPSGRWIVFNRQTRHRDSLWIVASVGGKPQPLTHCQRCVDARPAWSPNGRLVLFQRAPGSEPRGDSLYTVRPNGSHLTKIKSNAADPAWSPDGSQIAYDKITLPHRKNGALFWDQGSIGVVEADGSHPRLLTPERWRRGQPLFTAPGPWARGPRLSYPAWSPDGHKLLFLQMLQRAGPHTGYREEIWTMSPTGSDKKRLYQSGWGEASYAPPIWSPNGQMIAFASSGKPTFARIGKLGKSTFPRIGKILQHVRDEARRNRSQVLVGSSFGTFEIKPNGTVLKQVKDPTGIFVMNADGTGLKRVSPVPWPQLAWQPPPKRKPK
jgi:Tol biopolymer transport system component